MSFLAVFAVSVVAASAAQAAGGPFWKTENRGVLGTGGETRGAKTFNIGVLKLKTAKVTYECQKVESTGTLIGGNPGTDAATISFKECSLAGKPECKMTGLKPEKAPTKGEIIVAVKTVLVYPKGKAQKPEEALDAFVPEGEGAEGAAANNLFVEFELTGGAANCGTLNLIKVEVRATGTEITRPPFRRKCGVLARLGTASGVLVEKGALKFPEPAIAEAELFPEGGFFKVITCGLEALGEKAEEVGEAEEKTVGPEPFGWEV